MVLPVEHQPVWWSVPSWRCCCSPSGLRLGPDAAMSPRCWPVLLGARWLMLLWLAQELRWRADNIDDQSLLTPYPGCADFALSSPARLAPACCQGRLIAAALLQSLPWAGDKGLNALLRPLTGGLTWPHSCLVFLALSHQHRLAAAGDTSLVSQPVNWRGRHLIWYLLLFSVSLWLQLGLPAELSRFRRLSAPDYRSGTAFTAGRAR